MHNLLPIAANQFPTGFCKNDTLLIQVYLKAKFLFETPLSLHEAEMFFIQLLNPALRKILFRVFRLALCNQITMKKKSIGGLFALIIFSVFLNACDKEDEQTQIPYVYVNFAVYPNTLDFIPDGGWSYFSGGYKGLIIYRPLHDEFLAFERACPYDPLNDSALIVVESSGIIASDAHCGSRFLLTDGSPFEGPASVGLKQYRTRYDGYTLTVSN